MLKFVSSNIINPANMAQPAVTVAHVPVITSVHSVKRREPEPAPRATKSARWTTPSTQYSTISAGLSHDSVVTRPRALSTGCEHRNLPEPPSVIVGVDQQRNLSPRPRAQSSGAEFKGYQNWDRSCKIQPYQTVSLQNKQQQQKQQPVYMNVPAPVTSHVYMNLPLPASIAPHPALTVKNYQSVSCSQRNVNSRTPLPDKVKELMKPSTGLNNSYIEIWDGDKENHTPGQNLKSSKLYSKTPRRRASLPAYVEMSSPCLKSETEQTPKGISLVDMATKLAEYASHVPRNIFCSLCPRYFGDEKSLGSHLQTEHHKELNNLVFGRPSDSCFQCCPICQARFFNSSVLPKHLVDFHRASVVELLEKKNCIRSDATGIQCPFCPKKVNHGKTGEQVLLYHMQQLHLEGFEKIIHKMFKVSLSSSDDLDSSVTSQDVSQLLSFYPDLTSTPDPKKLKECQNSSAREEKNHYLEQNKENLNLNKDYQDEHHNGKSFGSKIMKYLTSIPRKSKKIGLKYNGKQRVTRHSEHRSSMSRLTGLKL